MIGKNEVLEMAEALSLSPDTIEKDYVLGWMLYGISKHRGTENWAFKGGTSLKKCFFETFRFSEDRVPRSLKLKQNSFKHAAQKMMVGPSQSRCRLGLQTTHELRR